MYGWLFSCDSLSLNFLPSVPVEIRLLTGFNPAFSNARGQGPRLDLIRLTNAGSKSCFFGSRPSPTAFSCNKRIAAASLSGFCFIFHLSFPAVARASIRNSLSDGERYRRSSPCSRSPNRCNSRRSPRNRTADSNKTGS